MLEASADGGALKTERKGVSLYDVRVARPRRARRPRAGARRQRHRRARPPGAGWSPRSADPARGHHGDADRRPRRHDDQHRAGARGRSRSTYGCGPSPSRTGSTRRCARCAPVLPGARLEVTGGPNRPPLEAASSAALFERAARARRSPRAAGARRGAPSAARRTATSPPVSARRRSTGSVPSAAGRTPTTNTSSSTSCPAGPRCCGALRRRSCWRDPTNRPRPRLVPARP